MDTTTAAHTAKVAIATIRTWCKVGAVEAKRISGRWNIDATSLTRRIEIAAEHRPTPARNAAPLTSVKGTIPTEQEIEAAARQYNAARIDYNAASRTKNAAEKILKRTPDGTYGPVTVERFESTRQIADLDAIKAIFEAHGLGDVPVKTCTPSLVLTFAAEAAPAQPLTAVAA